MMNILTRVYKIINMKRKKVDCLNPVENLVNFIGDIAIKALDMIDPGGWKDNRLAVNELKRPNQILADFSNKQYANSIKGKAERFVLQYPLVVSNALTPDTIEVMRNQIEIETASEIAMVLQNTPVQTYDPVYGFLSDLHTNISLNDSVETVSNSDIRQLNEDLLLANENRLEKRSLNEFTISKDYLFHLNEIKEIEDKREREETERIKTNPNLKTAQDLKDADEFSQKKDAEEREKEEKKAKARGDKDYEYKDNYLSWSKHAPQAAIAKTRVSDITKQNRSTPLIITTKVNYLVRPTDADGKVRLRRSKENHNNEENYLVEVDVQFGVKAVTHLVESKDVEYFLGDSAKHSSLLTKLVKLTTGEISFVKDILLRDDRSRRSAISSRGKNRVWKNLNILGDTENAKRYGKVFGNRHSDKILPTTTLLLSIDEVDGVYNNTARNLLTDSKFAHKVYSDLYLMGLIIVDEPNDIFYKYSPGNKTFDRFTMKSLEGNRMNDSKKSRGTDTDDLLKLAKRKMKGY